MSDPFRSFLDSMSRAEQRALGCLILVAVVSIGVRQYQAEQRSGYQLIGQYDPDTQTWVKVADSASAAVPIDTPPASAPLPAGADASMAPPSPPADQADSAPSTAQSAPLDINTATETELMTLPNIGAVRARGIVAWRQDHGIFRQVDDLTRVPGIGPMTVDGLRPYVVCRAPTAPNAPAEPLPSGAPAPGGGNAPAQGHAPAPRDRGGVIDLNTADLETLMLLPGIGETLGQRILDDRARNGPFRRAEDLTRVHGIGSKTLEQILPFLRPAP